MVSSSPSPSSFRSSLIECRLEEELKRNGGRPQVQFGFVRERSTIPAINAVIRRVEASGREWVALVKWLQLRIMGYNHRTVTRKGVSMHLINIIEDHFYQKRIME